MLAAPALTGPASIAVGLEVVRVSLAGVWTVSALDWKSKLAGALSVQLHNLAVTLEDLAVTLFDEGLLLRIKVAVDIAKGHQVINDCLDLPFRLTRILAEFHHGVSLTGLGPNEESGAPGTCSDLLFITPNHSTVACWRLPKISMSNVDPGVANPGSTKAKARLFLTV